MAAPETLTIEKEQGEASAVEERLPSRRKRNAAIFVPLAALWLVLDIATKAYFNGFSVGQVVAGPFLGLVQFRLVHNTGAAWGMFDESTFALGVMSVLVCVALTVYLFTAGKRAGVMETVGIALIVAGGLGNALDRFTLGRFHRHGVYQLPYVQRCRHRGYLRVRAVLRGDALVHEEGCAREGGRIGGEVTCSGDDPLAGRR